MNTQEVLKDTSWQIRENLNKFSIEAMKKDVLSYEEEWLLDESRQKGAPNHSATQMYQIRHLSYDWEPEEKARPKEINSFKSIEAQEEFKKMCNFLENFYDGKVVRVEIIRMNKNSVIPIHVDSSTMLYLARRVHVPLVTNENVFFTVFTKTINMQEGKFYEINNYLPHSVNNNSEVKRIHAILDILPNKYFEEK